MRIKNKNIADFFKVLDYMKKRKFAYIFNSLGLSGTDAFVDILLAFAMKDMIDAAITGNTQLLLRGIIMILSGAIVICIIFRFCNYRLICASNQTLADVRLSLFKRIENLPVKYYEKNHSGDLISRITRDVTMLENIYMYQLRWLMYNVFVGVGSTVAMFILDWRMASILIVSGLIATYVITKFVEPSRKASKKSSELSGEASKLLSDLLSGFREIKLFNIKNRILDKIFDRNEELRKSELIRSKYDSYIGALNFLFGWINYGGIIVLGSYLVLNNDMTFGTLIAITQLVNGTSNMFRMLGRIIAELQNSLAGAKRIFDIMDEPEEPDQYDVKGVDGSDAIIEFKDVCFAYDEEKTVLDKISFQVDKGQIAALVGTSGGGKSTLIKILLGFYPCISGQISVMGKGMGEYTLDEFREFMAYVPQDTYLYEGTIEENIRYGMPEATKEQVEEAARIANAHDFIMEQPDGYDTTVGERGIKLSGGQKQRIAIARALLKDAPILLLDEATSSLDSESEQLVQQALNTLMQGRTVIAIAHRLSTIQHADVIYVIEDGQIAEQGKHNELLEFKGIYHHLFYQSIKTQAF